MLLETQVTDYCSNTHHNVEICQIPSTATKISSDPATQLQSWMFNTTSSNFETSFYNTEVKSTGKKCTTKWWPLTRSLGWNVSLPISVSDISLAADLLCGFCWEPAEAQLPCTRLCDLLLTLIVLTCHNTQQSPSQKPTKSIQGASTPCGRKTESISFCVHLFSEQQRRYWNVRWRRYLLTQVSRRPLLMHYYPALMPPWPIVTHAAWPVCWSWAIALQKQLNRSRHHQGFGIGWAQKPRIRWGHKRPYVKEHFGMPRLVGGGYFQPCLQGGISNAPLANSNVATYFYSSLSLIFC